MSYIDRDRYGIYKTSDGPGPALMGADTLIGDSVVNAQEEDLGDIKEIMLDVDKQRLQNAPGFDTDRWPDMSDVTWAEEVHTFYGTTPGTTGMPMDHWRSSGATGTSGVARH